jgi:hypothetical protein
VSLCLPLSTAGLSGPSGAFSLEVMEWGLSNLACSFLRSQSSFMGGNLVIA